MRQATSWSPCLRACSQVSAIAVTVESAPLRSDSPALSRTWLALFSAVLAGAAASCPFAAGLAAPEPSNSASGLMVFARVVALETTFLRSTVPSVVDSSLVKLPVAVGEARKVGLGEIRRQSGGQV